MKIGTSVPSPYVYINNGELQVVDTKYSPLTVLSRPEYLQFGGTFHFTQQQQEEKEENKVVNNLSLEQTILFILSHIGRLLRQSFSLPLSQDVPLCFESSPTFFHSILWIIKFVSNQEQLSPLLSEYTREYIFLSCLRILTHNLFRSKALKLNPQDFLINTKLGSTETNEEKNEKVQIVLKDLKSFLEELFFSPEKFQLSKNSRYPQMVKEEAIDVLCFLGNYFFPDETSRAQFVEKLLESDKSSSQMNSYSNTLLFFRSFILNSNEDIPTIKDYIDFNGKSLIPLFFEMILTNESSILSEFSLTEEPS